MKKILVLCIVFCLAVVTLSQGGGGRSGGGGGGRSRSSSGGSGRRRRSGSASCETQCTVYSQATPEMIGQCILECQARKRQQWNFFLKLIGVGLGGAAAVGGGVYLYNKVAAYFRRREYLSKLVDEHRDYLTQEEPPVSTDTNEAQLKRLLTEDWAIVFRNQHSKHKTQKLKIQRGWSLQLPRHLYKIHIESSDYYGDWTAEGYVSFTSRHIRVMFLKDYKDKARAGQTGSWELLCYRGTKSREGLIEGEWLYEGFRQNSSYSGRFRMMDPVERQIEQGEEQWDSTAKPRGDKKKNNTNKKKQ